MVKILYLLYFSLTPKIIKTTIIELDVISNCKILKSLKGLTGNILTEFEWFICIIHHLSNSNLKFICFLIY